MFFYQVDFVVICNGHLPIMHTHSISGGSGQIWLDNVNCSSSHIGTLADCSHSAFGSHNCTHSEDVALVCVGGQSHAQY